MSSIPAVVPPLPREHTWKRNASPAAAFGWLSAGWRDFTIYSGSNFLAKTLEQVWAGQKKIDQAMAEPRH